jgi:integrase
VLGADTDPNDITYDGVVAFIGQRRREGLRGQSIRKEVQALKRGFKIALRRAWLDQDLPEGPIVRSDPPRKGSKGKLVRVSDLTRWLDALEDEPKAREARLQAELVLRTGLRSMEARRLCWSWVEPAPDGVDASALLRVPAEAAKNRRERVLGLTPEALAIVETARQGQGWDEPLLPGSHVHAYQSASRKIGHRSITLRDLRHCHATWAAQGTGDAAAAQAALGHSDLRTTQRYLTATVERVAGAAKAVGAMLAPQNDADPDDDPQPQSGPGRPLWEADRHSDRHSRRPGSAKTQVEMVGETGFEPAASCSQSRCSTRLSYSPARARLTGWRLLGRPRRIGVRGIGTCDGAVR